MKYKIIWQFVYFVSVDTLSTGSLCLVCRRMLTASEGGRSVFWLRRTLLVHELAGSVSAVLLRRLWRQRQQVWVGWAVWGRVYESDNKAAGWYVGLGTHAVIRSV